MKLLILCEKPDVKRSFEKALGGTTGFFSGHRFTDSEVASLLAGKVISFKNINKNQVEYTAHGKLAKQSFKNSEGKNIQYYGFKFLTPEAAAEFKLKE